MQESYSEVLARHAGPESYADGGDTVGVATTGVHAGPVSSSEIRFFSCADAVQTVGRQDRYVRYGQARSGHGGVEDLAHAWKLQVREPGDPIGRLEEVASRGSKTPLEVRRT
jgi:hypothetical protein